MNESDYWQHLEFRVCQEFAGLVANNLRFLWCDGFIPEKYLLDAPTPHIAGRAWIGSNGSTHQEEWEFTLLLNKQFSSRFEIDWDALLPPARVTRWIAADPHKKRMEIDPSAAVADDP
jgi:hypothetical protein